MCDIVKINKYKNTRPDVDVKIHTLSVCVCVCVCVCVWKDDPV